MEVKCARKGMELCPVVNEEGQLCGVARASAELLFVSWDSNGLATARCSLINFGGMGLVSSQGHNSLKHPNSWIHCSPLAAKDEQIFSGTEWLFCCPYHTSIEPGILLDEKLPLQMNFHMKCGHQPVSRSIIINTMDSAPTNPNEVIG